MEGVINFIREYDFLFSTIFSAVAALFAILAYFQAKRGDKSSIRREIKKKQAELKTLSSMNHFVDGSSMGNTMIRRQVLQSEIEQLKSML